LDISIIRIGEIELPVTWIHCNVIERSELSAEEVVDKYCEE